jgi:type IV pilus assembly protein PilX
MLTYPRPRSRRPQCIPRHERGIVLLVSLVVLAAMTLAAISMMRSVLTSNRVAGNLAFQQSATQSADIGIEQAIAWLEANNGTLLDANVTRSSSALGYFASSQYVAGQSWEAFWNVVQGQANTLAPDAAGNTVSFVIERLCNSAGAPTSGIGCAVSPTTVGNQGGSRGAGAIPFEVANQRYYRITARVTGPRNTVSFVQAVVAL